MRWTFAKDPDATLVVACSDRGIAFIFREGDVQCVGTTCDENLDRRMWERFGGWPDDPVVALIMAIRAVDRRPRFAAVFDGPQGRFVDEDMEPFGLRLWAHDA